MKKLFTIAILLPISLSLMSQMGKVSDDLSMQSKILKMERKYAIYFPPDYETSSRKYPVLYLLHGSGDDQTGWVQFGEVLNIADKVINSGEATPMIIVMPDANTGRKGYVNDIKGEWLYEDFFIQEFIPYIEKTYRVKPDKHYRAVAGLSMGGEGTFIYALHHPEMFCAACPLSAATGPKNTDEFKGNSRWQTAGNSNEAEKKAYFNKYSVLNLVENMPENEKKSVKWYIDCGDDDFLYEGNALVHIAMRKKDIPHEYRVRDGAHNWNYWRSALPEVLKFVSAPFHQ